MIISKTIADSISPEGVRLTTLQVTMPKIPCLAQLNTHRMFSRNAASSRAIPVSKVIERIRQTPVVPTYWGKNKPGMSASEEISEMDVISATCEWYTAISNAVSTASRYEKLGVHKQTANRLLEPFMYIDVVITATEWDNFYRLRLNDGTQPVMQEVARKMKESMDKSTPRLLQPGEWHLPYVSESVKKRLHKQGPDALEVAKKYSVARCARVSYLNHDNSDPNEEKDLKLYDMLFKDKHLSPFEHQATPMHTLEADMYYGTRIDTRDWELGVTHMGRDMCLWSGNFKGWIQNRQLLGE